MIHFLWCLIQVFDLTSAPCVIKHSPSGAPLNPTVRRCMACRTSTPTRNAGTRCTSARIVGTPQRNRKLTTCTWRTTTRTAQPSWSVTTNASLSSPTKRVLSYQVLWAQKDIKSKLAFNVGHIRTAQGQREHSWDRMSRTIPRTWARCQYAGHVENNNRTRYSTTAMSYVIIYDGAKWQVSYTTVQALMIVA